MSYSLRTRPSADQDADGQPIPSKLRPYHGKLPSLFAKFVDCWVMLWGLFAPLLFLMMPPYYGFRTWRMTEWGQKAFLVLQYEALLWLYPLLAFSAYGIASRLTHQSRCATKLESFAILSGAVLWSELYVVWVITVTGAFGPISTLIYTLVAAPIAGGIGTLALLLIIYIGNCLLTSRPAPWIAATLLAVTCGLVTTFTGPWYATFYLCAIPLAVCTYIWSGWTLLSTSKRRTQVSLTASLAGLTWIAANVFAWKQAVLSATQVYEKYH